MSSKKNSLGVGGFSDFEAGIIRSMLPPAGSNSLVANKKKILMEFADPLMVGAEVKEPVPQAVVKQHDEAVAKMHPLVKSVMNVLNGPGDASIERLAFESNPANTNQYGGIWKRKLRLLPDEVLKRISIQDDLVAAIANTRSGQLSAFGRPQPDRFSTGYRLEPSQGHTATLTEEAKAQLQQRIAEVEAQLLTCGSTSGWDDKDAMNMSQFLWMQARNAVIFGRISTEIIHVNDPMNPGQKKFHSFRPIDAGTVFRAAPYKEAADSVRKEAFHLLETLKNRKLTPERFINDEYTWIQVIDGTPRQAFTSQECVVYNFYPTTDVELDGYPVTPLDTVITAVTTHINIGTHNKLYFQSGRATRGMLVVKSDDVDEKVISFIRQQFNASINSVGNSWRMPIFGVGTDDEIGWYPIDNSARDMEFQYLSDSNARVILSAFQMSPEELPGYAHLSRGTNSQALSESSSEYKLEAARDVGIRPLLGQFQNFINASILPVLAPDLAKFCSVKFVGLDADTAEKESTRLQQDMAVHMTMDEVLEKVEKRPIGKRWAGQFLLNPQWQQVIDKYMIVGDILEQFFGIEGASKDPRFQYVNNPLWFNWQQIVMQQQQAEQQAQQAQQAQAQGQPPPDGGGGGEGGPPPQDGGGGGEPQQKSEPKEEQGDLSRSVDQLSDSLSKGEQQLTTGKKKLLVQQRAIMKAVMKGLEEDAKVATDEIMAVAKQHVPAKLAKGGLQDYYDSVQYNRVQDALEQGMPQDEAENHAHHDIIANLIADHGYEAVNQHFHPDQSEHTLSYWKQKLGILSSENQAYLDQCAARRQPAKKVKLPKKSSGK
jgi:hypothetical protein